MKALPRKAVVPALDLEDSGKRKRRARAVLVLGDLPATLTHRLRERGAVLTSAANGVQALALLADTDFDAVIIEMSGDGPDVISAVKEAVEFMAEANRSRLFAESVDQVAAHARQRHRVTPFFLFRASTAAYEICVSPPDHVYEETGKAISLPDAVMCLDVGTLLLWGAPLA